MTRTRHPTPSAMSSNAAHTVMTVASDDIATVTAPATLADVGEAIPRLPNHLVVEHILRSEHFDDPADLARLPAVSRAMRAAVASTGLAFEEIDEERAAEFESLSAVLRLQLAGRLSRREYLCEAAARSGKLKKLKLLRAGDLPVAGAAARLHILASWHAFHQAPQT